jgi:hypothetical protein
MKEFHRLIKIAVVLVLLCDTVNAQTFTSRDSDSAQFRIYDYWQDHAPDTDSSKSEYLQIILETGADGRIKAVHLMADIKSLGSIPVAVLSKITPAIFSGWKPANYPNGVIIIPIYCSGSNGVASYADDALCSRTLPGLDSKIIWQCKNSVMTSGILMPLGYADRDYRVPHSQIRD